MSDNPKANLSVEERTRLSRYFSPGGLTHDDQLHLLAHAAEMDKREAALIAERDRLREALVTAVVPLEVIRGSHCEKPFKELHQSVVDAVFQAVTLIRETLATTAPATPASMSAEDWPTCRVCTARHHAVIRHAPPLCEQANKDLL